MGIFTRFRDIINANINTMLERAEDPEKLIKLMIQEMEDTLVEIKSSCAGAMAERTRVRRAQDQARERAELWAGKAQLAIDKGRDDLAREALMEKRRHGEEVTAREAEIESLNEVVEGYQKDIAQLEEKLATARQKHKVLVQRHRRAQVRTEAQRKIRKAETSDAFVRFEQFENRIDRMEADGELVNYGRKNSLEDEFDRLQVDDDIEQELAELKAKKGGNSGETNG